MAEVPRALAESAFVLALLALSLALIVHHADGPENGSRAAVITSARVM